ncbi:hypothetical protein MTR_7g087790 [Medicago truncatula]|uniref:Uncharacterized protein n=1 Tax=Medicago truncatula TaxID=3880 RepID=G7L3P4_MEDTR|nr:hypothetical protein MTR_7g087790 [Medicago truncatula]
MATSSKLFINNGLTPRWHQFLPCARFLHRQRLDLFTFVSSPRKFAECLYCDVSPSPILLVLSRFIESHVIYSHAVIHSHSHTFTHSYNHAFINIFTYSYVYTYTSYAQHQFTHNCISRPESRFGRVSSVQS